MSTRVIIDPITRIEGHLKIEVEVEDGKVKDAWSSGTMYRGFEKLLEGKDPRDAPYVTSRFCGVCFSVHTMASSMALDAAFGAKVPTGGRLMRNLMMGAQYLYDHILHFYHLSALDYLDVMAIAGYEGEDADLKAVKEKVVSLVKSGDTHPLTPRYEPDEYCVKDPETVTTLVKHYLDALRMQMLCKKMGAIFGGRAPHYQSIVVGGVTQLPTAEKVAEFRKLYQEAAKFTRSVYATDVVAVGTGPLMPLAKSGFGKGHGNYLSYGAFLQKDGGDPLFAPGVITGDLGKVAKFDPKKITESVKHAWYRQAPPVHPSKGEQEVDMGVEGAYSFVKAPRYDGQPYEVGPLARMLVAKNPQLMDLVAKGAQPGVVARHASRAFENLLLVEAMGRWLDELEAEMGKGVRIHDTDHWAVPDTGEGAGFYDAPRGALGHWITIEGGKTKRYQAVVPSTWNASPRDEKGVRGQYEESLIGIPVPDVDNPLNVVRVIRSFDPCLACAIHMIDPRTNELKRFVVDPVTGA
jgi:Ni,Fe-hydrogenase I large subunit